RDRDDERGGEAAPPPTTDVAQPDLGLPRQEPDPAQEPVTGILAPDRRTTGFEPVAERDLDGAPDRGERRQRRGGEAHQRAEDHDAPVDAQPSGDGVEVRAE